MVAKRSENYFLVCNREYQWRDYGMHLKNKFQTFIVKLVHHIKMCKFIVFTTNEIIQKTKLMMNLVIKKAKLLGK